MNANLLIWGLVISSIGLGYFMYGKKVSNGVIRYTGLALMVYPYFVHNTLLLVGIGGALLLLPKFLKL